MTARAMGGHILVAGALLTPLIAILAPRALVIVLIILTLAALVHGGRPWRSDLSRAQILFVLLVVGLLAWALLGLVWVPDAAQGAERWIKLTLGAAFGLTLFLAVGRLDIDQLRRIGRAASIGIVIGLVYVAVDLALDGAPRRLYAELPVHYGRAHLNRGMTMLVLLIWPAALWLWRWRRPAAPLALVMCGAVLAQAESDSAFAAFGLGLVVLAATLAWPRGLPRLLAVGAVVATIFAPMIPTVVLAPERIHTAVPSLPSPAVHRLYIWRYTAERVAERPVLGWGLDAARDIPGRNIRITTINPDLSTNVYGQMTLMPLHPHNAPLQFWLELGLPGGLALALIIGGLLWAAGRLHGRADVAVATTVIVVGLSLSSFSYGVWQSWWLSGLWLTATMTIVALRLTNRPADDAQKSVRTQTGPP